MLLRTRSCKTNSCYVVLVRKLRWGRPLLLTSTQASRTHVAHSCDTPSPTHGKVTPKKAASPRQQAGTPPSPSRGGARGQTGRCHRLYACAHNSTESTVKQHQKLDEEDVAGASARRACAGARPPARRPGRRRRASGVSVQVPAHGALGAQ